MSIIHKLRHCASGMRCLRLYQIYSWGDMEWLIDDSEFNENDWLLTIHEMDGLWGTL